MGKKIRIIYLPLPLNLEYVPTPMLIMQHISYCSYSAAISDIIPTVMWPRLILSLHKIQWVASDILCINYYRYTQSQIIFQQN